MRISDWMTLLIVAGLLSVIGCSKPAKPEFKTQGVVIDFQKMYGLSSGTSPDVQNAVRQAQSQIQYGRYVEALANMDKVANDPSLNETQKKDASELINQLKQLASKGPTAQAQ